MTIDHIVLDPVAPSQWPDLGACTGTEYNMIHHAARAARSTILRIAELAISKLSLGGGG